MEVLASHCPFLCSPSPCMYTYRSNSALIRPPMGRWGRHAPSPHPPTSERSSRDNTQKEALHVNMESALPRLLKTVYLTINKRPSLLTSEGYRAPSLPCSPKSKQQALHHQRTEGTSLFPRQNAQKTPQDPAGPACSCAGLYSLPVSLRNKENPHFLPLKLS